MAMLTRKAAVETAANHLAELVPTQGPPVLEEYFFSDGIWNITLSYHGSAAPGADGANGSNSLKEYKSFAIDGRTGEVLSMKIRSLRN